MIEFTYDDVLILPQYSEVRSRSQCDISTTLESKHGFNVKVKLQTPIIAANMDSICGYEMADYLDSMGAAGIIHRYMPVEETIKLINISKMKNLFLSVGTLDNDSARIDSIIRYAPGYEEAVPNGKVHICVDIAHGHSIGMKETLQYIRNKGFKNLLIGGNVATSEAAQDLVSWGCDVVKVGVGPGAVCSTRTKTGVGRPQFRAVGECSYTAEVQVIADGGFKYVGDFAKAMALGAKACMTGSFFAGCDYTPNWKYDEDLLNYRGMASAEAQKEFKGKFSNAEGISTYVKNKGLGSTEKVLHEIQEGLRSSMSYVGALDMGQFAAKARFIHVSNNTLLENKTRL
jgi:IMP dehydrogenase